MRHGKKFNHLGRTSTHRKAMLSNMAASLIINKRITTTVAKAKALRQYVEPLITKSKTDTTQSRRVVFSYLQDKASSQVLFSEVAEKVADRPGGYTRIIKLGTRMGDNAEIALIELVDFNDLYTQGEEKTKTRTRRSRRGGKKKSGSDAATSDTASTETAAVDTAAVDTAAVDTAAVDTADTTTSEEIREAPSDEGETPVAEVEVTEKEQGEVVELSGGAVVDEPVVIEETIAEEEATEQEASTQEEEPQEEEPKATDETASDTDDEEKEKDKP